MTQSHHVSPSDIGMLRIYLKPGDKGSGSGRFVLWGAKPLYRELVLLAKKAGIMNAVAHHTHYGYSNHGAAQEPSGEYFNPKLTMCVELVGHRPELETFCGEHGALLRDKVIVFKHIEHWTVGEGDGSLKDTTVADDDGAADPPSADLTAKSTGIPGRDRRQSPSPLSPLTMEQSR